MNRLQVKIVKSTAKAHLIAAEDGRQGWIQQRWLAADGTVAVATFEKAVGHATQRQDAAKAASDWSRELHPVRVAKETERAVGVTFRLELINAEREVEKIAWFPKSMIGGGEGIAMIPGWLLDERRDIMLDEFRQAGARIVSRGIIAKAAESAN